MMTQLEDNHFSESDTFHMEMIIGDLLSLYTFLSPKEEVELRIPIKINENWRLVSYTINQIALTPEEMGSPVVAYGLHADSAPPLLLFKGTTYPTDKGFGLSILTDINPGDSVGAHVFNLGKNAIKHWLSDNVHEFKAIVYGKSLGGALASKSALNFHNQIDKVMAYGAPGFTNKELKKAKKLCESQQLPEINIFCQKNDPVPYFDCMAEQGVNYFQVVGERTRNGVLAHADLFSTHEKSIVFTLDPSIERRKWKRFVLTSFRSIASFPIFYFLLYSQTIFRKFYKFSQKTT